MKKKLLLITVIFISLSFTNDWIDKADAQGNFVWAKQFAGDNYDYSTTIKVDGAGNVYTLGAFGGTCDFDPGVGEVSFTAIGGTWDADIFISKLDASGNVVWAKQIGSSNYDQPGGMDLDAEGNIYLTGSFQGTIDVDPGPGEFDLSTLGMWNQEVYVTKLDATGNFVWAKRIGGIEGEDSYYAYPTGISVDASGNIYSVGSFQGIIDFDPGAGLDTIESYDGMWGSSSDIYVSKLNASGDFVWAKRFGGTEYDNPSGIALDKAGNVFTTGGLQGTIDFDPGAGVFNLSSSMGMWGPNENVFISKLDASGSFAWAKKIGGEDYCSPSDITADTAGNVYVTGYYEGTTDFNPGTGTYNLTPLGGMYGSDIFVSKLDNAGNFGWARSLGGPSYESAAGIAVDVASNVYVTGSFQDSADFNPRSPVYNLTAVGLYSQDIFVCKLDDAGSFLWAKRIGGTEDFEYNQGGPITVDKTANAYVSGTFEGTVDFDPGAGVFELSSTPGMWGSTPDVFVLKLHDTLSTVNIAEQLGHGVNVFSVYPNPSNGTFNLAMNLETDSKLNIEIIDIAGQLIKTIKQSKLSAGVNSIAIDASELSSGIYFVKIYNDDINNTLKFLINK